MNYIELKEEVKKMIKEGMTSKTKSDIIKMSRGQEPLT